MHEEHGVSIRRELLNAYIFRTLEEVREKVDEWQHDYNHLRPHKSLGYRPPIDLLSEPKPSSCEWAQKRGSLQVDHRNTMVIRRNINHTMSGTLTFEHTLTFELKEVQSLVLI